MSSWEVPRIRALNVVTTAAPSEIFLEGIITALTGDLPGEFATSTTSEFKLIPFQNTAISREGIEELVG